jgi:hypothetical protein
VNGVKKYIKSDNIRHLAIPQYDTLTIKQLFAFLCQHRRVCQYFPIEKEMGKISKQWIVNIIYSVVGEPFADWVTERIKARNDKIVADKNMAIEMDPVIAQAFANSNAVSSK